MYEDQPADWVDDLFEEQLLGENALGRSTLGKKGVVLELKHQDFVGFKKDWYKTGRMSLAVVGAVEEKKARREIEKYFQFALSGSKKEVSVKVQPKKDSIFWQEKETQQTHLQLGLPTVAIGDERKWPARVLNTVLGRGFSSRLWRAIREKRGWAYYIYSYNAHYLPAGYLTIKAGVKNEVAGKAIDLIKEELINVKKDLKSTEVARAKKAIIGRFLISMENPSAFASLLNAGWLFEKKVLIPQKFVGKIEKVTFRQTRDFAQEFVRLKNLRGAVIGPK